MEDFGVRINMPKDEGQRIVIRGYDQGAEDCKDHLLLLLQEFEDEEAESVHGTVSMDENGSVGDGDGKGNEKKVVKQANNGLGFVMKGAPWEDAFPSLGGTGVKKSAKGVWGKKSG